MAKWLGKASQGREIYSQDLEVTDSNPRQADRGTSKSYLNQNYHKDYLFDLRMNYFVHSEVMVQLISKPFNSTSATVVTAFHH